MTISVREVTHSYGIKTSQQGVRNQVNDLSNRMDVVSSEINELSNKIGSLNENMQQMMNEMHEQVEKLERARRMQAKKKKVVKRPMIKMPSVTWQVQAVIPGRAWLIGSNGSTITVRKGSDVKNIGRVAAVDADHGKVYFTNGKTIQFSAEDS